MASFDEIDYDAYAPSGEGFDYNAATNSYYDSLNEFVPPSSGLIGGQTNTSSDVAAEVMPATQDVKLYEDKTLTGQTAAVADTEKPYANQTADQLAAAYSTFLTDFMSPKGEYDGSQGRSADNLTKMMDTAKGGDSTEESIFGKGLTGPLNKLFGTAPGSKGESLVLSSLFAAAGGLFGAKDKQAAREANTMVAQSSMLRATTEAKVAEDNEKERQRRIAATGKGLLASGPRKQIGYSSDFNPIYKKAT